MAAHSSIATLRSYYSEFVRFVELGKCPLLFAIRLYWGWQFFQSGLGKLQNVEKTTEFFASIHLPYPHFNALASGTVECVCGLFLFIGLLSRLSAIPLIITMAVAYVTTEMYAIKGIWDDPDAFIAAAPFLFLSASLIVLIYGPGRISLDYLLMRKLRTDNTFASENMSSDYLKKRKDKTGVSHNSKTTVMKSNTSIIAGAALAGILSFGFAAKATAETTKKGKCACSAGVQAAEEKGDTHDCKGKNSCKGKGGCKSEDNSCAGKNSCKGKGGCAAKEKK